MLDIERDILPVIDAHRAEVLRDQPELAETMNRLREEFRVRFTGTLDHQRDNIALCGRVTEFLREQHVEPEVLAVINAHRKRMLAEISALGHFAHGLGSDLPTVPAFGTMHGPLHRPRGLGEKRSDSDLEKSVNRKDFNLLRLAAELGFDAAADVLYAFGDIYYEERSKVISYMKAYLPKSASQGGSDDLPWLLSYPAPVLRVPTVRAVVERRLKQHIYQRLVDEGIDTVERHDNLLARCHVLALAYQRELATQARLEDPNQHADLFITVSKHFKQAADLQVPKTLVSSIQNGHVSPIPSLRQRLAMLAIQYQQHLYVGFEPGKGKTFVPVWKYEAIREKKNTEGKQTRMLYIGPNAVIGELPNRIHPGIAGKESSHSYYVDEQSRPSVGIIDSSLKTAEMKDAVKNTDMVFMPYTMLGSVRDGGKPEQYTLIDELAKQEWDIIVIDEAHLLNGDKKWTEYMRALIHGDNGFFKNGHLIALSGTPTVNSLGDMMVVHDFMENPETLKQKYGRPVEGTRGRNRGVDAGINPVAIRNSLNRLLILDPPEDWEKHIEVIEYNLSQKEMAYIDMICRDPHLSARRKIDLTLRFIRCPELISEDPSIESTFFKMFEMQMEDFLAERHAVLIAEHSHAQGILRERDAEAQEGGPDDMELYFFKKVERMLEQWSAANKNMATHFHTIHGKVDVPLREEAYRQAEDSQTKGDSKTVMLAYSDCLNLGINLSFVKRMLSLYWPYNSPMLQQLLKRSLREGNKDTKMTVFVALETIEHAIYRRAQDKYRDIREGLYGSGISDDRLSDHAPDNEEDEEMTPASERELDQLIDRTAPTTRQYEIGRWLHGRGTNDVDHFWERHRPLWNEMRRESDRIGTGDMQRFLGGLVAGLMRRGVIDGPTILHANSGGMTIEHELHRLGLNDQTLVLNTDPHQYMFEEGRGRLHADGLNANVSVLQANVADIGMRHRRGEVAGAPFDAVVLQDLERCHVLHSAGTVHERARALLGTISTLKENGTLIISMPRTACRKEEEFEKFVNEVLPIFGCEAVKGWSGEMQSSDNEGDQPFRGFCVVAKKVRDVGADDIRPLLTEDHFRFTHHSQWPDSRERQTLTNQMRRTKLRDPLRHEKFEFNRKAVESSHRPDMREEQVERLRILEEAVGAIKAVAADVDSCKNLTAAQRRTLAGKGIVYLQDISKTLKKPAFRLDSHAVMFYPYEQEWNDIA